VILKIEKYVKSLVSLCAKLQRLVKNVSTLLKQA